MTTGTKVKAPCTSPDEVHCHGCGSVFPGTVAYARAKKWRVGWQPGHPSWCPECWRTERAPVNPDIYDMPLFEIPEAAS